MSFFSEGADSAAHAGSEWADHLGHAAHHLDVIHDAGHAAAAAEAIHPDLVQAASHLAPASGLGNAEELLSYQDPLMHSAEYIPASFLGGAAAYGAYDALADGGAPAGSIGPVPADAAGIDTTHAGALIPSAAETGDLPGTEHGILVDETELGRIAGLGELPYAHHVSESEITRSPAARAAFLELHGLDHVPQGYEIHHIIPLSEGGADDPRNMILLTAEDHAAITAQHAAYYHWQDPHRTTIDKSETL